MKPQVEELEARIAMSTVADPPDSHRYKDFSSSPLYSLAGAPLATDVLQGKLADCWITATMSSLANDQPVFLESLVTPMGAGVYTVHLRDGDILVDSDLPVNRYGKPVYEKLGADKCIWPAIIEKAFAQDYGSYTALNGGNPGWANYQFGDPDVNYVQNMDLASIQDLFSHQRAVVLATDDYHYGADLPGPLHNYHAYSLVNLAGDQLTLRDPDGGTLFTVSYSSLTFTFQISWQ